MLNYKSRYAKLILISLILLFPAMINSAIFFNLKNTSPNYPISYTRPKLSMDEWSYSREISLNLSTPSNDYQIKITLDPGNFNYSHASDDGKDIRFLDQSQNQLSYWIEEWDNSGSSLIWVKIPDSGTSLFTMYYGNPLTTSESNGENTFIFFDDFEGTNLNLSKWTTDDDQYSSITVANSEVRVYTKAPSVFYERAILGFHDYYVEHGQTYGYHAITGGAIFPPTENTWLTGEMHWINSTSAPYYENGVFHSDDIANPNGPLPVRFFAHNAYYGPGTHYGAFISSVNDTIGVPERSMRVKVWVDRTDEVDIRLDWVTVRKWSSYEPLATLGAENFEPGPPIIVINSPEEGETILDSGPTFNLFIFGSNLHQTWYTLDDGITNITFVGSIGIIDQVEWNKQNYGAVLIRFYVNNTWGNVSYAEVSVNKVQYEWKFLREIIINPSIPEDNYQIKIEINPSIFNYSRAQANGEDIRFTDNNFNELPYWIEDWNPSGSSIIWVKVFNSATSSIFLRYGNPLATSESNGERVFMLYDDFEGTSLNTSKWISEVQSYCGISVSSSVVRIYSDAPSTTMIASSLGFHDTYVLEGQTYGTKSITGGAAFSPSEDNWLIGEMDWINSTYAPYYENDILYSVDTGNPSGPLPVRILARTVYYGPGRHYGAWISSINDIIGIPGRTLRAKLWVDHSGISDIRIDWVAVRKWSEVALNITLGEEFEITDPPLIFISNPKPNELFGITSPNYNLFTYDLDLDSTWYSLDGGVTNVSFTEIQGNIDQLEWEKFGNGTVSVIFYANDSTGQQTQKLITVRKDIINPAITINNPFENEVFGKPAPKFNLTIIEPNIGLIWYTLDYGATNITHISFNGMINQSEWNKIENGTVDIRFYVLDKVGNEAYADITIRKEISDPIVIINIPLEDEVFGVVSPFFNVSIIEPDFDSMWYTLDDGINNVTASGFTGDISLTEWNKKASGLINIRFYANDTLENEGYAEIVVEKDITDPTIQINTPIDDDIFGYTSPSYDISITDANLDSMWYTLDNGITDIPLSSFTGNIDQTEWDKKGSGTVSIRFYANDTMGNNDYIEILIVKDLIDPIVNIIFPNENEVFGSDAPTFEITVTELNLDTMWYTIDNGLTNIPFSSFTDTIGQTEWNKKDTGDVTIKFFAGDKAGNEGYAETTVHKDVDIPIITIYSPEMNEFANSRAPSFNITVEEPNLDLMWYTLDLGMNMYYFTEFIGFIDQLEWNKYGNGSVVIRFYVNDKGGNEAYSEVLINKDIYAPIVAIETPELGEQILDYPPIYGITIQEPNLADFWYSLDNGITNITVNELIGVINEERWDALPDGALTIRFYARDKAGNVGEASVIITKITTTIEPPPGIPGYNIIILIGVSCLVILIYMKKRTLKN